MNPADLKEFHVSIVIPLFNEEESFPRLLRTLEDIMAKSPFPIEIVMVDDGSTDGTIQMIEQRALKDDRFNCVFLSRNFGHQIALSAGIDYANATEALFIIDGDLQDPPELLFSFYEYYKAGYDVVYGIRKKRKEHWLKRIAYFGFYRLVQRISYIDMPLDTGDFALISRKVANVLKEMPEESRFVRGMRRWVGFKQIGVEYERAGRFAGDTKYSLNKLFKLAFDGIFNFSQIPIKFITFLGLLAISTALIYLIVTIIKKIFFGNVPTGFTGLLFIVILFSGVQLVSLGVIGEYILKIFFQVKSRPLYVISKHISHQKNG